MIALDTETTGVDFAHGTKPFYVTLCSDDGDITTFEWDVDPLTRQPVVPPNELREVERHLKIVAGWGKFDEQTRQHHYLVGQNTKFDCAALRSIGIDNWPWDMTHDTLIASHLLASNQPHDLTNLALHYLGHDIKPLEDELEKAVKHCRRVVQQARLRVKRGKTKATKGLVGVGVDELGRPIPSFFQGEVTESGIDNPLANWRIAEDGLPEMPAATGGDDKKGKIWRADYWLPRAYCRWTREQLVGLSERYRCHEGKSVESILTKDRKGRTVYPDWWEYADPDHPYNTVLSEYSNEDSSVTMALWPVLERELRGRGLWTIYKERMRLSPIALGLESQGITLSRSRLESIRTEYLETSADLAQTCIDIASSYAYDLKLPKSGGNDSLRQFCFGYVKLACPDCGKTRKDKRETWVTHCQECRDPSWNGDQFKGKLIRHEFPYLDLPVVGRTKSGAAQLSKETVDHYRLTLDSRGRQGLFVQALADKRKRDKDLGDFAQYERYGIFADGQDTFVLHPNVNPTGTDTLRWSFSRPNSANIKKEESECQKCDGEGCKTCHGSGVALWSVRRCFGPAPGREWWSLDYKNVELRIPAYESGEQELIALFEQPDDPPYYGSQHLLNFGTVYQDVWETVLREVGPDKVGPTCKKRFKDTYYQWVKNGDFALQYGAQKAKADATFHRIGAYDILKSRFSKQEALNQKYIRMANKLGYVMTLPDRTVDPEHGYPLMVTRTSDGRALPTVPLAYHVSGTAMWITARAMVKTGEQLTEWKRDGYDGWLALQCHDELVFDLPQAADPKTNPRMSNLSRVRVLQRLMESCGDDVGIPTPCGVEYHTEHWASGVSL